MRTPPPPHFTIRDREVILVSESLSLVLEQVGHTQELPALSPLGQGRHGYSADTTPWTGGRQNANAVTDSH